jgi:hypothetical protein
MPRARRAPRKPKRLAEAKDPVMADDPEKAERLMSYALDFEEPLYDAVNLVRALKHIGSGLIGLGYEDARPVMAVASAAEKRLNHLHDVWEGLLKAAKG